MNDPNRQNDWNPRSTDVLERPVDTFDRMRKTCPVAHSDYMGWSVFRHADVMAVISDDATYGNQVSRYRSVPNGLDKPEHTPYRKLIEPFFNEPRMTEFEPVCRRVSEALAPTVSGHNGVDVIPVLAEDFALKIQCAFLGWPANLQEPLRQWAHENHQATLAGDRDAMVEIAQRFSGYIHELLEARRAQGEGAGDDVTTEIMNSTIDGRPLPEADIVSILRNWTVGEIGTISASVGILLHFLARHPELQQQLRREPERIPEAVDEMLRLHGPLITNRRKPKRAVTLGGRHIEAGERVSVNWVSANRDERVFPQPGQFRWGRDHRHNLLYGAGLHVCPGAPLARLELRVLMEAILEYCGTFQLTPGKAPRVAHYPASGYQALWIDFPQPAAT